MLSYPVLLIIENYCKIDRSFHCFLHRTKIALDTFFLFLIAYRHFQLRKPLE